MNFVVWCPHEIHAAISRVVHLVGVGDHHPGLPGLRLFPSERDLGYKGPQATVPSCAHIVYNDNMLQYQTSKFQVTMGLDRGFDLVSLGDQGYGLYSRDPHFRNSYGTPLMVKGPLDELMKEFTPTEEKTP